MVDIKNKLVDLSIVIINYNTFQLTCNCIKSIYDTSQNVSFEIILVDNGSHECSAELFLREFPEITLIASPKNLGFGRANNLGMEQAKGDFILLLNSDTLVLKDTLYNCLEYLKLNKDISVLGCKSTYPDGEFQMSVFDYRGERSLLGAFKLMAKVNPLLKFVWANFNKAQGNGSGEVYVAQSESPDIIVPNYVNGRRIGSLSGQFLLLRRNVWEETKGFDPDFFMYYEETEWFINRLFKYNIVYFPKASIVHIGGQSDVYGKMSLQIFVSRHLYWYKRGISYFIMNIAFNFLEIFSLFILVLIAKTRKQNWSYLKDVAKSLSYAFFDVPFYSNKFGSRKDALKINFFKVKD